jgi:hypothetical protein
MAPSCVDQHLLTSLCFPILAVMTNPFAKPAAKVTTPQNLERSQSLANALNSSSGMC